MWACVITAAHCGLGPADQPLRARSAHAGGRARAQNHVIVSEIRLDSGLRQGPDAGADLQRAASCYLAVATADCVNRRAADVYHVPA